MVMRESRQIKGKQGKIHSNPKVRQTYPMRERDGRRKGSKSRVSISVRGNPSKRSQGWKRKERDIRLFMHTKD